MGERIDPERHRERDDLPADVSGDQEAEAVRRS
jgi:hypothetical protein